METERNIPVGGYVVSARSHGRKPVYSRVQTWTEWREVRELDTSKSWMDRKWIQGWSKRERREKVGGNNKASTCVYTWSRAVQGPLFIDETSRLRVLLTLHCQRGEVVVKERGG
jgi:hypothetical protein